MTFKRFPLQIPVTLGIALVMVAVAYWAGQNNAVGPQSAFAGVKFDTAASSGTMSMATALIEPGYEALFTLDHQTGDLTCWILDPKSGAVSNQFRANVTSAMGLSAEPDFVMATGYMDFATQSDGGVRPARSVVYVGDGNSGNAIGYVLMYNKNVLRGGQGAGQLNPICAMATRTVGAIRDQGDR